VPASKYTAASKESKASKARAHQLFRLALLRLRAGLEHICELALRAAQGAQHVCRHRPRLGLALLQKHQALLQEHETRPI